MPRLILLVVLSTSVILFFNTFLPLNACAEGINLRTEFNYANSNSTITNKKTGDVTENESFRFAQQYNLNLSKTIYPYLTLKGGGIFKLESSTATTQDLETEREETTIKPYIELDLRSPLYTAGIGFRKTEIEKEITGVPTARNFKEALNAALGWKPVGFPHFRLFYTWTHTYNDFETVDSINKLITIKTRYTTLKDFPINYTYTRNETENRISSFKTLIQAHNGDINYSYSFFNRRLSMDTGYRIRYSTTELPEGGVSEASPLLRSAGLFSLDDTPQDGPALTTVTALIDGNLTTSSGIDIGWAGAGGAYRNIGLDFGFPVSVNKIYIWTDRSLSSTAASSFSWSVYTSPDNTDTSTWTLHTTVSPASFGIFQTRFEISFPAVETQFIKVVTSPLSAAFSGDPDVQNIYVTEMEALTTISTQDATIITTKVDHNYNLDLRGRLSDKTVIGYNLFYSLRETDPSSKRRTSLSNGIYANHVFNRVFSATTRLLRDDAESITEESVTYTYSALVKAVYMETFKQTLTYSSTQVTEENGSSDTNSIFLRNNAQLYSGWNTYLDTGYSWNKPLEGGQTNSTIIRAGTNVVPNEKITINMNYSATKTKQSEEGSGTSTSRQTWDLQVFYLPYKTLSLFARLSIDDRENSKKTYQNYSANWLPFPDGDLQFSLNYTERLRSADEQEERTIGPGLKWNISRHALLEMSYYIAKSESELETIDSINFNTKLRMFF